MGAILLQVPSCVIIWVNHHIQSLLIIHQRFLLRKKKKKEHKSRKKSVGLWSNAHPTAAIIPSATVSEKQSNFIVFWMTLAIFALLVRYPLMVSTPFLLTLNTVLTTFVSHRLMFSTTVRFDDQTGATLRRLWLLLLLFVLLLRFVPLVSVCLLLLVHVLVLQVF